MRSNICNKKAANGGFFLFFTPKGNDPVTQGGGEGTRDDGVKLTKAEREREIQKLEKQMREAARMMEYEYAAVLRDQIIELRGNGL